MRKQQEQDLVAAYAAAVRFIEGLTDDEVNAMTPRTLAALRNLALFVPTHKQI